MNERNEEKKQEVEEAKEKMDLAEEEHIRNVCLVQEIKDCGGFCGFMDRSMQKYLEACDVYRRLIGTA